MKGFDIVSARQIFVINDGRFEVNIKIDHLDGDRNDLADAIDELMKANAPYGEYHVVIDYWGQSGGWIQHIHGERLKPESPDADLENIPF